MPVRLVSYMENTPHGIRRTLAKVRKMREIRGTADLISEALLTVCIILFCSSTKELLLYLLVGILLSNISVILL